MTAIFLKILFFVAGFSIQCERSQLTHSESAFITITDKKTERFMRWFCIKFDDDPSWKIRCMHADPYVRSQLVELLT